MERGRVEEEWKYFLDKRIKIIYDDSGSHPSKKEGWLIDTNSTHLIIQIDDRKEAINTSKIIRIEEIQDV